MNYPRQALQNTCNSVSTRNMELLGMGRGKIQKVIKSLSHFREAQAVFQEVMPDTAGRIGGTRLPCPECNGVMLDMDHILFKCKATADGRLTSGIYTNQGKEMDISILSKDHTKIFHLIMETYQEIRHLISIARARHYRR